MPVHHRTLTRVRLVATTAIAGIAAWVSFWHMAGVAGRYGETGAAPYLIPLSVDGLIVVASICLVELGGRIRAISEQPTIVRTGLSIKEDPAKTVTHQALPPLPAAALVRQDRIGTEAR